MSVRRLIVLSGMFWLCTAGLAAAEMSPARTVQQFVEAHLQGHFAESRGFTLERVNLSASLFSNWLFGTDGTGTNAPTADVFLSRQFSEAFRYNITGTTPNGDNQIIITATRTSPNLMHMYTWALAPKRGAAPYELVDAIDTYLTKVNYPIEESRMHFTLIREAEEWYISAVRDEKFQQLQQQALSQGPSGVAASPPQSGVPPQAFTAPAATPTVATTTSGDAGRRLADAQFDATIQSFNYSQQPQPTGTNNTAAPVAEAKPSFLKRMASAVGLGGKTEVVATISDESLQKTFKDVRNALVRYASTNNGFVPSASQIYNWKSLRQVVNQHSKKALPATEEEAGFRFIKYSTDSGQGDYTLLVELAQPQDGAHRVAVTAYGIDRAE